MKDFLKIFFCAVCLFSVSSCKKEYKHPDSYHGLSNHFYDKSYDYLPNLTINIIFPKGYLGENASADYYLAAGKVMGIDTKKLVDFSESNLDNSIDLTLTIPTNGTFYKKKMAKYAYLFGHIGLDMAGYDILDNQNFKWVINVGNPRPWAKGFYYGIDNNYYFTIPSDLIDPNKRKPITSSSTIMYFGGTWDYRYPVATDILDKKEFFNMYGPNETKLKNKKSYRGFTNDIIETTQKHGIALVLHSYKHLHHQETTTRIFQAAAAGVAIISDNHPFIQREFGDSVLYINQADTEDKVAADIIKHYEWIINNPAKADEMAKKAQAIFLKKFKLENVILKIIALHQKTLVFDGGFPLAPKTTFEKSFDLKDESALQDLKTVLKCLLPKEIQMNNKTGANISLETQLVFLKGGETLPNLDKLPEEIKIIDTLIPKDSQAQQRYQEISATLKMDIPQGELKSVTLPEDFYLEGIQDLKGCDHVIFGWSAKDGFYLQLS